MRNQWSCCLWKAVRRTSSPMSAHSVTSTTSAVAGPDSSRSSMARRQRPRSTGTEDSNTLLLAALVLRPRAARGAEARGGAVSGAQREPARAPHSFCR